MDLMGLLLRGRRGEGKGKGIRKEGKGPRGGKGKGKRGEGKR